MMEDLLSENQRIGKKGLRFQVFLVHVDVGNLPVFIGGIVVHAARSIAAGGIDGDLRTVVHHHASAHMGDACKDMEKLRYAFFRRVLAQGMSLHKYSAHKSRSRGQIAGQTDGACAAAVWRQRNGGRQCVFRFSVAQRHVPAQVVHLRGKRRIVGQHAAGIILNMQAAAHGFHGDAFVCIADEVVQWGERKRLREGECGNADALKQSAGVCGAFALRQKPGDQLIRRDAVLRFAGRRIMRVAGKVQRSDAKAGFVDRVIVERIIVCDHADADHRQMRAQRRHALE